MTSDERAADIRVLSAGAPKTGVARCAEAYSNDSGHAVDVVFATAPVLRGRIESGEAAADVAIAPVPTMRAFEDAGLTVAGIGAVIGSVKAGVVVREGAPAPDISTPEAFKSAVLAADSVVYNQASSGLYIAQLFERLGIADEVAARTMRPATGAAVMVHVAASDAANVIGFGQITEIRLFTDKGVRLVGPLPGDCAKTTTYAAGLLADARAPEPATALIEYFASAAAKRTFVATGVE